MQNSLTDLSNELARLVEQFQANVVAVHARPRFSSSGVHWRPGIIVTADHTVRREEDIQVTLPGGETVNATLAGRDAGTDIAILKVDELGLPAARTNGSEPAKVGELALVIGRSPNSGANASLGIVSALSGPWRTWRGGQLDHYIRLDATLFPNSSGGAVINGRGQLLGVATSALSRIAGLAIPASTVDRVTDSLIERGHVPRAYLGIGFQPVVLPENLRTKLAAPANTGVMVVNVEPRGPADQAGVLLGDILTELGGTNLARIEDLQSFLDSGAIGDTVSGKVIRAGEVRKVTIIIGERPEK